MALFGVSLCDSRKQLFFQGETVSLGLILQALSLCHLSICQALEQEWPWAKLRGRASGFENFANFPPRAPHQANIYWSFKTQLKAQLPQEASSDHPHPSLGWVLLLLVPV